VREACGPSFLVSGGWAVPQMIEALDRGVDAMIPESSMVRVYAAVLRAYRAGDRAGAVRLFRGLLPVLAFSNQEVATSIAFFKRLLVRKGIFRSAAMRWPLRAWDSASERTAAELIDHYLAVEAGIPSR
jgi:4-hydroxy-tetrahydrodipicolinate synthase